MKVGCLREPLFCLELLCIPKRFASSLDLFLCSSTLLAALCITANSGAKDERSSSDKVFRHLCLSLRCASVGQICHVHIVARRIIVLLHDLDHLVALLVYFDKCKANVALGKLTHLVLDLESVRGALRVIISPVTDVLTMAWSVSYMERHLHAIVSPFQAKSLVESTLNIFREVTTSSGRLLVDVSLDEVDVAGEICHVKALLAILYIPVGDKCDVN